MTNAKESSYQVRRFQGKRAPDETGDYLRLLERLTNEVAAAREAAGGMDWLDEAACNDEDLDTFFIGPGKRATKAQAICESCPVLQQCRAYADNLGTFRVQGTGFIAGQSAIARNTERRTAKVPPRAQV